MTLGLPVRWTEVSGRSRAVWESLCPWRTAPPPAATASARPSHPRLSPETRNERGSEGQSRGSGGANMKISFQLQNIQVPIIIKRQRATNDVECDGRRRSFVLRWQFAATPFACLSSESLTSLSPSSDGPVPLDVLWEEASCSLSLSTALWVTSALCHQTHKVCQTLSSLLVCLYSDPKKCLLT